MALRDLNEAWGWIQRLVRRVSRLESGALLENSSITNGRMRFIGGLLRLDSGARLEGVGTFEWSGAGSIAGNWEVLQGGVIKVGGVLISPVGGGRIMVGEGPVGIILDGGTGTLTMGNIRLEGGKIYVGAGASQIVIDGATGKITAGNVTIETNKITVAGGSSPATLQEGKMAFGTGGSVEADTAIGGVRMVAGDAVVNAGTTASVRKGNASVIAGPLGIDINAAALRLLLNAPINLTPGLIPTQTGTGLPVGTLLITSTGALRRAA
ncbi:hypothetical protein RU09_06060 [Microbacterium sp. MEJ108Y]|uniref:hypothetical protein n=1 Tax=Microbacterium sp. MEJ108Y TaxID=1587523 RepID=UPI0005AC6DD9|nr:hypothetical protein [Microbacterium sp. MEJ108Y]KIP93375.1 hypothetical protein RU09_06060 [Microbacterium sp. MEJ108Y]